jgi:hypothetical protein
MTAPATSPARESELHTKPCAAPPNAASRMTATAIQSSSVTC